MKRKKNKKDDLGLTLTAKLLLLLFAGVDVMPRPFENKTAYVKRLFYKKLSYKTYANLLNKLEARGLIRIYKEKKSKYPELTEKGKLEALLIKAKFPYTPKWDGKWRMVVFDIPEDAKGARNKLRSLLKVNGFKQVQKSVYMNPYPLNQEAIEYLKLSGLNRFIRIFRIDRTDDETNLKKQFNL